ncbi:hypothetical protein [Microbacterium sp. MTN4-26]|uniref:hypothetical protein n=1 Tax=unclassified Microbacterium TaxID=2609290 RepID=UPI0036F2F4A6
MRDIAVGDRTITVRHDGVETTRYGEIQDYSVRISYSDVATRIAILQMSAAVDARVLRSVVENELLWDYKGSREHGLLQDPYTRAWRDRNRALLERVVRDLDDEILELPDEPVSEIERTLIRAFGMGADDD